MVIEVQMNATKSNRLALKQINTPTKKAKYAKDRFISNHNRRSQPGLHTRLQKGT